MPKQAITHFEGIYEETNVYPSSNYIFSELIETRSRNFDWVIKPHVHSNLFQIFFVASGEVQIQQSSQIQVLVAPCIMIIPAANLHGFSYRPDVTGRILSLSTSVIDGIFSDNSKIQLTLNTSIQSIQNFEEEISFEILMEQMEKIDQELFGDRPEKMMMLDAHFSQLLINLYRLLAIHKTSENIGGNLNLAHFRKFQKNIKQSEYPKSIKHFAEELGMSTVHLNRICKNITEKNALQLVQEFMIEEAKKYLTYTSYSVAEIAYLLKFDYPNYFAKFFRKETGLSPTQYRENRKALIQS